MRIALRLHGSIWSSLSAPLRRFDRHSFIEEGRALALARSLSCFAASSSITRPLLFVGSSSGIGSRQSANNRVKGESEVGGRVESEFAPIKCVCVSSAEGKEGRRMRLPLLFFLHLFYCPHLRNRDPALNSPPMADRHRHMETERERGVL